MSDVDVLSLRFISTFQWNSYSLQVNFQMITICFQCIPSLEVKQGVMRRYSPQLNHHVDQFDIYEAI